MTPSRTLTLLPDQYAICQLAPGAPIPEWAMPNEAAFYSITRTRDELSVICPQQQLPPNLTADTGWGCLKIEGPFELEEPGILASIISPLAQAGISVFAVATYDTDYLVIKDIDRAIQTLEQLTHRIQR